MNEFTIKHSEPENAVEIKYTLIRPESQPKAAEPVSSGKTIFSFKHEETEDNDNV